MNKILDKRKAYGISRAQFCQDLKIPLRTVEDWDAGKRTPPEYVERLILAEMDRLYSEK